MRIEGPTDPLGQVPAIQTEGPEAADQSQQTTGPGSLQAQQGLPQDECQTLSEGKSLIQEFKADPLAELLYPSAGRLAEASPGVPGTPSQTEPPKMVIRDHLVASHLPAGLQKSEGDILPAGMQQAGDSALKWDARPIGLQSSMSLVAGSDGLSHLPADMQQTQPSADDTPGGLPMASGDVVVVRR